ncbi:flagellar biosynthesis anti-sigma factor FlgM [Priestia endophytica]|uniref:flagellar biosynthesis anti-sigma factor FlgM n=1 Tax=Priestia endophytica TaxID=135735 RepID=UPI003D26B60C
MKINPFHSSGMNPYQNQTEKQRQVERTSVTRCDEVQISTQAKELQKTNNFQNERADKIERLKNQVQNGTYKVDAHKVASSLVDYYKKFQKVNK